jgi:hypothetical protein
VTGMVPGPVTPAMALYAAACTIHVHRLYRADQPDTRCCRVCADTHCPQLDWANEVVADVFREYETQRKSG